ncbi:MAG: hypothetical protein ACXVCY_12060 [Pseudobdellovibrionaceae bacterium]
MKKEPRGKLSIYISELSDLKEELDPPGSRDNHLRLSPIILELTVAIPEL